MLRTKWLWMVIAGLQSILACTPVEKDAGEEKTGIGFESQRKRRLIYYDSASQQSHGYLNQGVETPFMSLLYDVTDEQSFLDVRTSLTFDTQVDTYVWHIGNGCDPPYDIPKKMLWPCFNSYEQVRDVVIKACHEQGIEVWASLRMNDLHSSFRSRTLEETDDPLKAEHPEYLISPPSVRDLPTELTEQRLWVAFNYAHPGVRQHRLDFIEKTAAGHDFDGYELDFNRMEISFPLGEEQQHAHHLTDLIRQIRERLNEIAERRGRPYTLAIHVMDSLETSLELGMEVERWCREDLADVLLVGLGYMPSQVPVDQWVKLAETYQVQVYPTINPNTFRAGAWEEWSDKPVFQEAMRAAAAYFLQQGADGLYLFNFANEPSQEVTDEEFTSTLNELGDLEKLAGKDKLYGIEPTAHSGGPFYHGSQPALLPIVLDRVERKLPLNMGPDAADSRAQFKISLWTAEASEDTVLWTRLNHHLLPKPTREGPWYHMEVPAGVMRKGHNELSLWCNVPSGGPYAGLVGPPGADPSEFLKQAFGRGQKSAPSTHSPVIVHQILVAATYPETP